MTTTRPASPGTHMIVLPGGGYAAHAPHEAEPVARWLGRLPPMIAQLSAGLPRMCPSAPLGVSAGCAAGASLTSLAVGPLRLRMAGHLSR